MLLDFGRIQRLPHGVLLTAQVKGRQHPRQGCSSTDCLEYRRRTYRFYITHSPFTLANLSSPRLNLVSIFRFSSPPHNPVYVRRVDPSTLALSLSSHRHSYMRILFSSRFISSLKKQKRSSTQCARGF
jgi:hypothetical protein